MKASKLSRGFLLGVGASVMLVSAWADPPVKKPVPTKIVPKGSPPPRAESTPAPVTVPVPVTVAKTPPAPPTAHTSCWEDVPMQTVVTPPRQYFSPGFVVDAYCAPTVTLSPVHSTVPGSVVTTTGQNFVCR